MVRPLICCRSVRYFSRHHLPSAVFWLHQDVVAPGVPPKLDLVLLTVVFRRRHGGVQSASDIGGTGTRVGKLPFSAIHQTG